MQKDLDEYKRILSERDKEINKIIDKRKVDLKRITEYEHSYNAILDMYKKNELQMKDMDFKMDSLITENANLKDANTEIRELLQGYSTNTFSRANNNLDRNGNNSNRLDLGYNAII